MEALPKKRRPGEGLEAARREAQRARVRAQKLKLEEWVAAERERLHPEDKLLAPQIAARVARADREERLRIALSLRVGVSGRKRLYREIAAMMGVSASVVNSLFSDPDGSKQHAKHERARTQKRATRVESNQKRPKFTPEIVPPEETAEEFAAALKRRRRGRRISQVKLAEKLGVPVEMVRSWENGETVPGPAVTGELRMTLDL